MKLPTNPLVPTGLAGLVYYVASHRRHDPSPITRSDRVRVTCDVVSETNGAAADGDDRHRDLEVDPLLKKQRFLLERHWAVLEGLKQLRNRLPIVTSTMLLAITGYVLNSPRIPATEGYALGVAAILGVLTLTSVGVGGVIFNRYNRVNDRIEQLYTEMRMRGSGLLSEEETDRAPGLFWAAFLVIVVVGGLCALGVYNAPLAPATGTASSPAQYAGWAGAPVP